MTGSGGAFDGGGAIGSGGAIASGGATGSGGDVDVGSGGSDGEVGVGDAARATATGGIDGTPPDSGPVPPGPPSNGGCSCSVADRSPAAGGVGLLFAMAGLALRRRRGPRAPARR
jgi:MYXO-CTERM domain-containing protein